MKYLLDTHTLLWAMNDSPRLSASARAVLVSLDSPVYVSAVSIWEAATKYRLGKLPEAAHLIESTSEVLVAMSFLPLPLDLDHARLGALLDHPHRDPFDRMLAAQAIVTGCTLLSADAVFDSMRVRRLW